MANILKIKNEHGEWISVPAIKGEDGQQGPVGPQGPQGPKGDPGEVTTQQMTDYVAQELASKQDKLDSYSDSASVADDKLTINYKVKQEDGTYSNVPVEFAGGLKYTFTDGLSENNGTVGTKGRFTVRGNSDDKWVKIVPMDDSESAARGILFSAGDRFTDGIFNIKSDWNSNYFSFKISKNYESTQSLFTNNDSATIGLPNNKWGTLYCNNLSDGTTTKSMTEVLNKQDKLTAGNNITISEDNVISATVPTKTSQLTNDSGYLVNADLPLVTYSDSNLSGGTELKSIQVGDDKWNIPTSVKSVTPSKETWTFTLSDGSTVTKTIVTGITVA